MDKNILVKKLYSLIDATINYSMDSDEARLKAIDIFVYLGIAENEQKRELVLMNFTTIAKDLVAPDTIEIKQSIIDMWYAFIQSVIITDK